MKLLVEENVYDKRFKTCKTCEKFNSSVNRCRVCGCFMKIKAWIHTNIDGKLATCPHPKGNKWITQ